MPLPRCRFTQGRQRQVKAQRPHPLQQGVRLAGFRQEIAGPQVPGLRHYGAGAESGEDDDFGKRLLLLPQLAEQGHAVQTGEHHIHHQQVRPQRIYQFQGLGPVAGGTRHRKRLRLIDSIAQHRSEFFAGVRQQDSPSNVHGIPSILYQKFWICDGFLSRPGLFSIN